MQAKLESLFVRIDALSARERAIIAVAGLIAIVMGWYMGWGEPALQHSSRLADERQTLRQTLDSLQTELELSATGDLPGEAARQRLQQVRQRNAAVQGQIDDYAAELISPTEMARLLEKVLERQHALRLIRLANLGAEDLLPEEVPGEQRLYRHRFEMELQGPYLQCLSYLEDLEALPWRLYWQSLQIDAGEYPSNRIRIEVATLSVHEDWIGV